MTLADSLWLIIVTTLTIGYGDVVPATDGGRFLAIAGGLAGTLITALTIALTTEYLQLSRSESKVVSFLQRHKQRQQVQEAAALAIQTAFRLRKSLKERGFIPKSKHRTRFRGDGFEDDSDQEDSHPRSAVVMVENARVAAAESGAIGEEGGPSNQRPVSIAPHQRRIRLCKNLKCILGILEPSLQASNHGGALSATTRR